MQEETLETSHGDLPGVSKKSNLLWVDILENIFVELIKSMNLIRKRKVRLLVRHLLNLNDSIERYWTKYIFSFFRNRHFMTKSGKVGTYRD